LSGERTCEGFLASAVDCTLLDVTVKIPAGGGPHPLVALLHGWGGSKTAFGYIADPLFTDGHAVLRYSTRGFGDSWGQVNLSDVHVELQDLRSMIGQVVDHPELAPVLNPGAVGIIGLSYGGGQTWLSLLHPSFKSPYGKDVRIRAVVPIVPWSDLLYSLLPNGRPERSIVPPGTPKLSYINGLYFSGLRTPDKDNPKPQHLYPNYPDYLIVWHAWLNSMEPNRLEPVYRQIIDGVAGYRSIWWRQDFWRNVVANRVPVFQIQGLTDDLFPLPEAKRMLLALKAIDPSYPIASYFGDIGHPRAANKPEERDYMIGLIREWLGHYLLDPTGAAPANVIRAAITRPRDQPFTSNDVITVDTYGALASRTLTKEFRGRAILGNPGTDPYGGFCWDPLILDATAPMQIDCPSYYVPPPAPAPIEATFGVFRVPVAELSGGSALIIAGQPTVHVRATTSGPRVQLNIRLLDVDPAPGGATHLITRGTYLLQDVGTADLTIPTYGNLWEAVPGHVLQLEITNVDSPYLSPSRVPSVTEIAQVRLRLPVR
jgi:pimeloyl-ACP methyl ester carboxylesterase